MPQDLFERGRGGGGSAPIAKLAETGYTHPKQEVEKKKEELHPVAVQYVKEIKNISETLARYQEQEWKDTEKGFILPKNAAKDIQIMAATTEIMLQMVAEELLPPAEIDTELLKKVHGAPLATYDGTGRSVSRGKFLKKNRGGKGEMRENGHFMPAMRIDDIPEFADETYLVKLGETAQLDLLLRDIYTDFLLDVSRRLNYPDISGSNQFKDRLLHDLMYPDSAGKKEVPAPFSSEEYTEDKKKRVRIGGSSVSESQLEKFLRGEQFELFENPSDIDAGNRTVYIDSVYSPGEYRQERGMQIGDYLQPSPEKTVVPVKSGQMYQLDYIRKAALEIEEEAMGREKIYTREEVKLGVKYHTDPATDVKYPPGSNRETEQGNMRFAVMEYAHIKERMSEFLRKRLNGDEEDAPAVGEPAEKKPAVLELVVDQSQPKKETAADKLAQVSAERDELEHERDGLSVELTEVKKTAEDLRHSVDAVTVENTGLKDSIERLNAVLELSKDEAKEAKQDAGLRERELFGKLRDIQLALMKAGFGDRAVAMGKAVKAIDEILGK